MGHKVFSVTVKDVCNEAKLTERYFYESFKKSEELFQTVFLKMIGKMQTCLSQAVIMAALNLKHGDRRFVCIAHCN